MAYTVGGVPISLVLGVIGIVLLVRKKLIPIYVSPLLTLRGPPSPSILYGNFQQLGKVADPTLLQKWMDDYGPTFVARLFLLVRFHHFLRGIALTPASQMPCLWTADPRAINHVASHSGKYFKPRDGRKQAARILGKSQ